YISKNKFEELKRSEVKGGDLLIAKIGSCGKAAIYPEYLGSAMIPANLLKMTVHSEIKKIYVFYFLKSLLFKSELEKIITATAQPAFNVTKFRRLPIPLPPLPEQGLIVSKVEQFFSDLDNGIDNFKTAQAQLKLYRQSVIKAACEGKLVPTEAELGCFCGTHLKGKISNVTLIPNLLLFASATRFSYSKTWTYTALRLKHYSRIDSRRIFVAKRYQITEVSLTPLVKTTRTRKKRN
ncbi:MAG: hypothetical protein E4G94_03670, partial [ANME-2 cluster archaeon]